MTIFEDLLSDQKNETIALDFAPNLSYQNQPFKAAETRIEILKSETEVLSLKLTFRVTYSEQIQILGPLFAACGYSPDEARAFLNTPKARVMLSFDLKPALLESFSQQLLALSSIETVYAPHYLGDLQALQRLDLAYDLIKIEVEME